MLKVLLFIGIGIAIGYQVGYGDAHAKRPHLVSRMVERAGGSSRESVKNDADRVMRRAEQ
jgi:hypothetical protein